MSTGIPNEMRTTRVIVENCDSTIRGFVDNPFLERPKRFSNLMQLVLLLNALSESMNYPQRVTDQRTFCNEKEGPSVKTELRNFEDMADFSDYILTYDLRLRFRKAAGWQGSISCLETGATKDFEGDLGFLKFITDSLTAVGAAPGRG